MFSVADDFAAIAKRLKEIQQEVAAEATARARSKDEAGRQLDAADPYQEISCKMMQA
jgi:hypothetical protein